MRPLWMRQPRTSIWIRLAMLVGCETGKDLIAAICFGVLLGWLFAEAMR